MHSCSIRAEVPRTPSASQSQRGSEVCVLGLLGLGGGIQQAAGQIRGAVFPWAHAGQAAAGQLNVVRQPAFHRPHISHHHRTNFRPLFTEERALGQQQPKTGAHLWADRG